MQYGTGANALTEEKRTCSTCRRDRGGARRSAARAEARDSVFAHRFFVHQCPFWA